MNLSLKLSVKLVGGHPGRSNRLFSFSAGRADGAAGVVVRAADNERVAAAPAIDRVWPAAMVANGRGPGYSSGKIDAKAGHLAGLAGWGTVAERGAEPTRRFLRSVLGERLLTSWGNLRARTDEGSERRKLSGGLGRSANGARPFGLGGRRGLFGHWAGAVQPSFISG